MHAIISIVMAVFNAMPFIRVAVESVVAQTIGFAENVQLVLVDDGSTDESSVICDEYANKYPENIVVIHKLNGGAASARAAGLEVAAGEYIGFLDSDDMYSENALSCVVDFFKRHGDEANVVAIPMMNFGAINGEHWQNTKFNQGTRVIDLMEEHACPMMFGATIFIPQHVKHLVRFDDRLVCGEDQKVILTILRDKPKLGVVAGCWYMYRRHESGSLVQAGRRDSRWYGDYLTYLTGWAFNTYEERYGYVPAFVQYQMMCDLQLRIRENTDGEGILSPDEIKRHSDGLAAAFRRIDDAYIMEQKRLSDYQKCLVLQMKYDSRPTVVPVDDDAAYVCGGVEVARASDCRCTLEKLMIENGTLHLGGRVFLIDTQGEIPAVLFHSDDGVDYPCEVMRDDSATDIRFGRVCMLAIVFLAEIELHTISKTRHFSIVLEYADARATMRHLEYGRGMPLNTRIDCGYYYEDGVIAAANKTGISVRSASPRDARLAEWRLRRELLKQHNPAALKAIVVRGVARFLREHKHGAVVLTEGQVTDDAAVCTACGLDEQKRNGKHVYCIVAASSNKAGDTLDHAKLVRTRSFKHKLLHLISDYVIADPQSKEMMDPFGSSRDYYRDLTSGIKFIACDDATADAKESEANAR